MILDPLVQRLGVLRRVAGDVLAPLPVAQLLEQRRDLVGRRRRPRPRTEQFARELAQPVEVVAAEDMVVHQVAEHFLQLRRAGVPRARQAVQLRVSDHAEVPRLGRDQIALAPRRLEVRSVPDGGAEGHRAHALAADVPLGAALEEERDEGGGLALPNGVSGRGERAG